MASQQQHGGASALPFSAALAIIPSLPRPVLSRLVARAIERMDEIDGDADAEEAWPEWNGYPVRWDLTGHEDAEEDDPSGGAVEDQGELSEDHEDRGTSSYVTDAQQREVRRIGRLARKKRKRPAGS